MGRIHPIGSLNRIKRNLNNRIRIALKGDFKFDSVENLTGCTFQELKDYLEKKFENGMTWDNYGGQGNYGAWHIDHIIPCAKFDLSQKREQYRCFHYTNLRPMWARDNLEKNAKLEQPTQAVFEVM